MKVKKLEKDPGLKVENVKIVEDFDYSKIRIAVYPVKDISFEKYPLSPVKSLQVTIYTTESQDNAILHKLHTRTRSI